MTSGWTFRTISEPFSPTARSLRAGTAATVASRRDPCLDLGQNSRDGFAVDFDDTITRLEIILPAIGDGSDHQMVINPVPPEWRKRGGGHGSCVDAAMPVAHRGDERRSVWRKRASSVSPAACVSVRCNSTGQSAWTTSKYG